MVSGKEAKRVGIWIRVSTEDQVRGESPETHERRARLYAEAKGWNVVEVYRLDAMSGKAVRDCMPCSQLHSESPLSAYPVGLCGVAADNGCIRATASLGRESSPLQCSTGSTCGCSICYPASAYDSARRSRTSKGSNTA